jgi:cyclopropane-fatty-acyl-phospholipid synthase
MESAGISRLPVEAGSTTERPDARSRQRVTAVDRWLATRVQRTIEEGPVRLELWDGSSPYRLPHPAVGDLVVGDRVALLGLAVHPNLYLGEGYMTGRVLVRGSLYSVVEALSRTAAGRSAWRDRLSTAFDHSNSPRLARLNVHHHYDLGNAFYRQWLDPEMVYTCAYFATPDMPLAAAQRLKLDVVCRKLRLQPGELVVEAGCGWGALALHMARHYGVRVRAFNVSREQLTFARERASREGLAGQVEFIDDDYRSVTGTCDAFVSVGMLEHVGLRHYPALAGVLRRLLKREGGRGLLHFIGRDTPRPLNPWIRRRIFPGAYAPTIAEVTTRVLAPANLSVIDVENLRLHYSSTLAHWSRRFASARDRVQAQYGDEFCRAWELYLAGSRAAFATGWMQLFQVVFAPCESPSPFWSRHEAPARPAID